jgi:hypothetical protein
MALGTWREERALKDIGARSVAGWRFRGKYLYTILLEIGALSRRRTSVGERLPRRGSYWVAVGAGCGLGQAD